MNRRLAFALVLALSLGAAHDAAAQAPSAPAPARPTKPARAGAVADRDSLTIMQRAVMRDSSNFDMLYRLGVTYLDRDRPSEAVRMFAKASRLRPTDVPTLVNLGAAHDAAGDAVSAQDAYRRALELSPEDPIAHCRMASSVYAIGKHSEAVDLLRTILVKQPNSHCGYFTLGIAFADAGIFREAVRMWRKVVELAPDSPEAISARESIEVLEKFVKLQ